jgi:metallo-beta-lactamase family protein
MEGYPQIIHRGGKDGVTGSCHELRVSPEAGILIDCGLFQGDEENQGPKSVPSPGAKVQGSNQSLVTGHRSPLEIDFPVEHLRALVVTHVHIDHVGRIPWLLAAGFRGPVYCSQPSALLLPLMLEDAFRVGITRDARLTEKYLAALKKRIVPIPYGQWQAIPAGMGVELKIRLQPAGHILGSAYVEARIKYAESSASLEAGGKRDKGSRLTIPELRIVFSGDLGAPYAPLLPAPRSPYRADLLVLESTYGDRLHEGRKGRQERLQAIIEHALTNRGTVLIPAFALGRTQELLYELEGIIHQRRERPAARGLPWQELEIVLDSPLANRITGAYRQLRPFWDAEAQRRVRSGRRPLGFEQLTVIEDHADHENAVRLLQRSGRPCIVIAAGGMCSGGRIVNYLKALLGDARTDVLFIGYQARGTPGRAIQDYGPRGGYVVLDGERIDIRAQVHTLGGYSAHADAKNLIDFVRRMRYKPAEIRLVHGEPAAREALAELLRGSGYLVVA